LNAGKCISFSTPFSPKPANFAIATSQASKPPTRIDALDHDKDLRRDRNFGASFDANLCGKQTLVQTQRIHPLSANCEFEWVRISALQRKSALTGSAAAS